MLVDTEDHLLLTRQHNDEFQLLAGRMHQRDSHIAFDLGNFSVEEIAAQEIEAQHVKRSNLNLDRFSSRNPYGRRAARQRRAVHSDRPFLI